MKIIYLPLATAGIGVLLIVLSIDSNTSGSTRTTTSTATSTGMSTNLHRHRRPETPPRRIPTPLKRRNTATSVPKRSCKWPRLPA